MKNFDRKIYRQFLNDVKQHRKAMNYSNKEMFCYTALVLKFVHAFNYSEQKKGPLDFNDLLQEGFMGLAEGWRSINWKIIERSDDKEKTLLSFLSLRITGRLMRALGKEKKGQEKLPITLIGDCLKEEVAAILFDDVKGFVKPIHNRQELIDYIDAYESKQEAYHIMVLNDMLSSLLYSLPEQQRKIISWNFGLNGDRLTLKEIAQELCLSLSQVKRLKTRALSTLNNEKSREEFRKYI